VSPEGPRSQTSASVESFPAHASASDIEHGQPSTPTAPFAPSTEQPLAASASGVAVTSTMPTIAPHAGTSTSERLTVIKAWGLSRWRTVFMEIPVTARVDRDRRKRQPYPESSPLARLVPPLAC
jgi:hypothetical protein